MSCESPARNTPQHSDREVEAYLHALEMIVAAQSQEPGAMPAWQDLAIAVAMLPRPVPGLSYQRKPGGGAERKFRRPSGCTCCHRSLSKRGSAPMLHGRVWRKIAGKREYLCAPCLRDRMQRTLGRDLRFDDLTVCSFNLRHLDALSLASWQIAAFKTAAVAMERAIVAQNETMVAAQVMERLAVRTEERSYAAAPRDLGGRA